MFVTYQNNDKDKDNRLFNNNDLQQRPLSSLSVLLSIVFSIQLLLSSCFLGGVVNGQQQQPLPSSQLVTDKYFGTPLGPLSPGAASGYVFAPDENTLFIKGFTFQGSTNPYSYFQAGSTILPDGTGFTLADEQGSFNHLSDYKNKDIILKLPAGRSISEIRWFSIWNRNNHLSMGHVFIPVDIELPRPLELPPLTSLAHEVRSGPITIVDTQTILIPNFWYDGLGPAAYWWATRGPRQSPQGLRLKDEKGSVRPLRAYHGETVLLTLPDKKTIYDFDWLGIWCEEFQVDFGNVRIPQHIRVPPSPAMLNIKPEAKLNCEVFDDLRGFEMRWILDNDDIVIQLVGKMLPNEYMAVGWGRDDTRSLMVGADALVTWIDAQGQGHAKDYYISAKEPCIGTRGTCPDLHHSGATDSVTLLHAAIVNGFRMITVKRPQLGVDEQYDQHIYSDGQQAIIWAYGPLNHRNQPSYHTNHQYGNRYIDFARSPQWNCPSPDQALMQERKWQQLIAASSTATSINQTLTNQTVRDTRSSSSNDFSSETTTPSSLLGVFTTIATVSSITSPTPLSTSTTTELPPTETNAPTKSQFKPWSIPKIVCPKDKTLWAQMGPVGGPKRGYQALTGRKGWGIAWYINGLLIPELVLKRGTSYTFWVEGGNDIENNAQRHPLYLTTSEEGGFQHKTMEERRLEHVFAGVGVTQNGTILPTAEGRLCKWRITPKTNLNDIDGSYPTFEDFHRTLALDCDQSGQPGMLRFTPDHKTPDLLYYQCYNHRYMGWKIHIVDQCPDENKSSSIASSSSSSSQVLQSADSTVSQIKTEIPPLVELPVQVPIQNRVQNVFQAKPAPSTPINKLLSSSIKLQPFPILSGSALYPGPVPQLVVPSLDQRGPLVSSASSGSFMLNSLQNFDFFDSLVDGGGHQGLMLPAAAPGPLAAIPVSVNPYTPPFNFHSNPSTLNTGNQMMKKFGIRYPAVNIHQNHQNPRSSIIQSKPRPSSSQQVVLQQKQDRKPKPKPSPLPVLIQSGGFVPITSVQNKYNNRIWPSLKSKSKNKFNHQIHPDLGFDDILRIQPMNSVTSTTITPSAETTTISTTTLPTTTEKRMDYHTDLKKSHHNDFDRKILSGLEYSNGLLSDKDDDPEETKLLQLQSSASSLMPKIHFQNHYERLNQRGNETIDQTILSDVLRMIAHNIEVGNIQSSLPSSSQSSRPNARILLS